jgi:hypothetical protein
MHKASSVCHITRLSLVYSFMQFLADSMHYLRTNPPFMTLVQESIMQVIS